MSTPSSPPSSNRSPATPSSPSPSTGPNQQSPPRSTKKNSITAPPPQSPTKADPLAGMISDMRSGGAGNNESGSISGGGSAVSSPKGTRAVKLLRRTAEESSDEDDLGGHAMEKPRVAITPASISHTTTATNNHTQSVAVTAAPSYTPGQSLVGSSSYPSASSTPSLPPLHPTNPSQSMSSSMHWVRNPTLDADHSRASSAIEGVPKMEFRPSISEKRDAIPPAHPPSAKKGESPQTSAASSPVQSHRALATNGVTPDSADANPVVVHPAPPSAALTSITSASSSESQQQPPAAVTADGNSAVVIPSKSVPSTSSSANVPLSQSLYIKGPPSPLENLRWYHLSMLTVWWASSLIVLGNTRPLDDSDVPEMTTVDTTPAIAKKFLDNWQKTRANGGKGSVVKALFLSFGKWFFSGGFMLIFSSVFQLLQPIFVQKIVNVLKDETAPSLEGYMWSMALVIVSCLSSLFLNQHFFNVIRAGNAARASVICAIYDKALKLSRSSKQVFSTGSTVNIMSNDSARLMDCALILNFAFISPAIIIVTLALMIAEVGVAAIAGVVLLCLLTPLQTYISRLTGRNRRDMLQYSDKRVKLLTEVLQGIRIVKLYAWNEPIAARIESIRKEEMVRVKTALYLNALNQTVLFVTPALVSALIMSTYALLGHEVNVSNTFSILAWLNIIRNPVILIPMVTNAVAEARVSVQRIQKFLALDELPRKTRERYDALIPYSIRVSNANFSWSLDQCTPTLSDITVSIKPGSLVAIIGSVGSGKSSLLSALLGELLQVKDPSNANGAVAALSAAPEDDQVLINGTIAYASQESWIRNDTVRGNILFGLPYDQLKYEAVLDAACLRHDISILPSGDMTEIGERGINLSGGQRARLSVARALYRKELCDIFLLDDPFAAVDLSVGSHIFQHAILNLLQGKTRVLVLSSHLHLLEQCDHIIVMEQVFASASPDAKVVDVADAKAADAKPSVNGNTTSKVESSPATETSEESTASCRIAAIGTFHELKTKYWALMSQHQIDEEEEENELQEEGLAVEQIQLQGNAPEALTSPPPAVSPLSTTSPLGAEYDPVNSKGLIQPNWPATSPENAAPAARNRTRTLSRNRSHSSATDGDKQKRLKGHHSSSRSESKKQEEIPAPPKAALIEKEERAHGSVGFDVYVQYFSSGERSARGVILLLIVLLLFIFGQTARVGCDTWLSFWSAGNLYADRSTNFWITVYFTIVGITLVLAFGRSFNFMKNVALRASNKIHDKAFRLILQGSVPQFFDTTPLGRIINRFSKDLDQLDTLLPTTFFQFAQNAFTLIGVIVVCISGSAYMAALFVPIGIAFFAVQRYFRSSQRGLKRIENTTRSPIFSLFQETLTGLSVIRAYGVEDEFRLRNTLVVEQNNKVFSILWWSQRWLALRLDWVAILVVVAVSFLVVGLRNSISVGVASLALVYSLQFTGLLQLTTRNSVDAENYLTSVERLMSFNTIPVEAASKIPEKDPPPSWPQTGAIQFCDLQLRYRPDLPLVLKGISCMIHAKEKIGICGRTGSGKSSLMQALFRMVEPASGTIRIDGVDITQIGLEPLRKKLSIIPQESVLFSSSLRDNLDPFNESTDAEIMQVLERVHLTDMIKSLDGGLQHMVSENGENLSQGTRQLLCIARALLRKSKIIILDEATSSVDAETDALIQDTIRTNFANATQLTIAHRLESILDSNRILLLGDGKVLEFDTPVRLLSQPTQFRALVSEGGAGNLARFLSLAREAEVIRAKMQQQETTAAAAAATLNGATMDSSALPPIRIRFHETITDDDSKEPSQRLPEPSNSPN